MTTKQSAAAKRRWANTPAETRREHTAAARQRSLPKVAASSTLIAAAIFAIEDAGGHITWNGE